MTTHTELIERMVDELRATLREPPNPINGYHLTTWSKFTERLAAALESTERLAGGGEPVAWLYKTHAGDAQAFTNEPPPRLKELCLPLYTTPPPQAERVPLTIRQIAEISHELPHVWSDVTIRFARAIERAHGITPKEGT